MRNSNTEIKDIFRDIFENIDVAVYLHDLDGNFLEINYHFIKRMGYSKSELKTKNLRDLIPEQHKSEFDGYLQRIKTKGYEKGLFKVVTENGSTLVVEYINSLVMDKDNPIAVRGVARDITEQFKTQKALKRSEKKLKESEQKYRDLFQNINAYIYIHDLDGNYIETNSYFLKKTGFSKGELKTKNLRDLSPKEFQLGFDKYLKRIKKNGSDQGIFSFLTKGGDLIFVEYTNSLIYGKDGPIAVRGLARDITEHIKSRKALKESNEKLIESERKYRDIFENINEYIYLHDLDGRYIEINPQFIEDMGYSRKEILTKTVKDMIPEEYKPLFGDYLKRIKINGAEKGLLNILTKQGEIRVVHYTNSLVLGKGGPVAVRGVARDITEEFKARNALQKSEEALRIARDSLEKRVKERTRELELSNEKLKAKTNDFEEANIALRVLLARKDEAQKEVEEKMLVNINDLILPLITKMKMGRLNSEQKTFLDVMESNLKNIIAPFAVEISSSFFKLTPTEIQVANFIREGKTSKEIASLLNLAMSTVHTHRYKIRTKLGIKSKKLNLRSHLITHQK